MQRFDKKTHHILESYFDQKLQPQLLEQMEVCELSGGEWLFHQGDPGNSLYFLIRGRLQAWLEVSDTNESPQMLGEMLPGESVGEVGLITGEVRSASMKAVRDSRLIRINSQVFEILVQNYPDLVLKIAKNVANLLQRRTNSSTSVTNSMKTISITAFTSSKKIEQFCQDFKQQFDTQSSIVLVSPESLSELGAPGEDFGQDVELSIELKNWISDLEDQYEYVIFQCQAKDNSWSRFVERQSDIMLLVADAKDNPEDIDWNSKPDFCQGTDNGRQVLFLLQKDRLKIQNTQTWLKGRNYNFHLHIQSGLANDIQRAVRIICGKSIGLVFSGGAARALAGFGVYKALHEANIEIDWVGGTSLGAVVASVVATGWPIDKAMQNARDAFLLRNPFGDITFPTISLLRGNKLKRSMEEFLDFQIEDLPIPFYCVSTNLGRGVKNIHEADSLVSALRASTALPGVFPPLVVNNELAVDGALLDNLPIDIMQQKPISKIIAADFSTTSTKKVDYTEVPSPWAILKGRWLPFTKKHRVPKLASIIMKATETATLEQIRKHGEMADLLINPDLQRFGMTEIKSFDKIVQAGYEHTVELLKSSDLCKQLIISQDRKNKI